MDGLGHMPPLADIALRAAPTIMLILLGFLERPLAVFSALLVLTKLPPRGRKSRCAGEE